MQRSVFSLVQKIHLRSPVQQQTAHFQHSIRGWKYRAVRWSALPLFDERKKRLALLRTWLYWIPKAIVLFPSQCCTHLFKTTRSNRKSCLPPIFREVIQKPCKRTKAQPTVGRVDFSTKEPRRCFSILLVWRTCWHTGFHVLGSLWWTFIYVTPSTLSTIDYLHESLNILHVKLKRFPRK